MSDFKEIVAYDYVKNEFSELLYMFENKKQLSEEGVSIPNGVLLWGPADCGKLFMAWKLREKLGIEFYDLFSSDEDSELAEFLDSLQEGGRYGLFIHEVEEIKEEPRIRKFIDRLCEGAEEGKYDLFILATMNGGCDDSWPYEGLFEKRIHVRYPNPADIKEIFEHLLAEKDYPCDLNIDDICAMLYHGITYKEIKYVLDLAITDAYTANRKVLTTEGFIKTYCEYMFDLDEKEEIRSRQDIEHSAYHIAGHVAACELLHPGSVNFASIITSGTSNELERGFYLANRDHFSYEESILEDLASIAAVDVVFHLYDTNTYHDIESAMKSISNMVMYEGVEGLDLVSIYDKELCSSELRFRQEKTIHRIAQRKMDEAKALMIDNRALLDAVAEKLMSKHYITASQVRALGEQLRGNSHR